MKIEEEITGYTPYETYSNLQDDSVDYLLDVNPISLEDNCSEEEKQETNIFMWYHLLMKRAMTCC